VVQGSLGGQINACRDALTKRRNANSVAEAMRLHALIQSIPDNPYPRPHSCMTNGIGGSFTTTCY
jgi:hypothetical protein